MIIAKIGKHTEYFGFWKGLSNDILLFECKVMFLYFVTFYNKNMSFHKCIKMDDLTKSIIACNMAWPVQFLLSMYRVVPKHICIFYLFYAGSPIMSMLDWDVNRFPIYRLYQYRDNDTIIENHYHLLTIHINYS